MGLRSIQMINPELSWIMMELKNHNSIIYDYRNTKVISRIDDDGYKLDQRMSPGLDYFVSL